MRRLHIELPNPKAEFSDEELEQIRLLLIEIIPKVRIQGRFVSDIEGEIYTRLCGMVKSFEYTSLNTIFHGRQRNLGFRMSDTQRRQLVELIKSVNVSYTQAYLTGVSSPKDEISQMRSSSVAAAKAAEDAGRAVISTELIVKQLAELEHLIEGDKNE